MPPKAVKTIRGIIYYQYSKIMSNSANFGKNNYAFIMSFWKELMSGEKEWSTSLREWIKERENPDICVYCGKAEKLTKEHILPASCNGEDVFDNIVWVCRSCNSTKNSRRLYEWKGLDFKDNHNRVAEGKYLKYLYHLHERLGTLDISDIEKELCPKCNMHERCEKENSKNKLSVYCIEGCFHK